MAARPSPPRGRRQRQRAEDGQQRVGRQVQQHGEPPPPRGRRRRRRGRRRHGIGASAAMAMAGGRWRGVRVIHARRPPAAPRDGRRVRACDDVRDRATRRFAAPIWRHAPQARRPSRRHGTWRASSRAAAVCALRAAPPQTEGGARVRALAPRHRPAVHACRDRTLHRGAPVPPFQWHARLHWRAVPSSPGGVDTCFGRAQPYPRPIR